MTGQGRRGAQEDWVEEGGGGDNDKCRRGVEG